MAKSNTRKRRDTKLESEGAEFFVLGNLLLRGLEAHKAYTNHPQWDIIAVGDNGKSARIQVKSRIYTNWDGFIIKKFETDFVVFVALNRFHSRKENIKNTKPPEYYILPIEYILEVRDINNAWGKISRSRLGDIDQYKDRWDLIVDWLS